MRLAWISDWNRWGNGKGYTVHNSNMKKAVTACGAEIVDNPAEADVVIDVIVPTAYRPVEGKFNILFTMYEMDRLPKSWIKPIQAADLIVVPCQHNKYLFQRYTDKPVEVCQEGVDPALYQYVERSFPAPDQFFNFLWVGASNPRKGYELVCAAWECWIKTQPQSVTERTRMILKSTKESENERVGWMFGAVIDLRRLSDEELITLYAKSHAFLLPSMGEGWGLTLCEAQATGLPCVYTPWSGPRDFMKREWSYPVRFKMHEMGTILQTDQGPVPGHRGCVAMADILHILRRMEQIYYGYEDALKRGKRGSDYIRANYTWAKAGERFVEIIEKHTNERLETGAA